MVQYLFPGNDLFYFLHIPFPSFLMCPIPPFFPISFSSFLSTASFYCFKTPSSSSSQTCFPPILLTLTFFHHVFALFITISSYHSTLHCDCQSQPFTCVPLCSQYLPLSCFITVPLSPHLCHSGRCSSCLTISH